MKKSIICRKRNKFNENVSEEEMLSVEEYFRINYFVYIVDQAISSIMSRFEQFQMYENMFRFLFNFKKLQSLNDTTF